MSSQPRQPLPPQTFPSSHPFSRLDLANAPHLPAIKNDALYQRVFTHKSAASEAGGLKGYLWRQAILKPGDDEIQGYEKLAHVGDALLGAAVSLVLNNLYPDMSPGAATKLRACINDKAALAYLSDLYDLGQYLVGPAANIVAITDSERNKAELFEAYIAAVYYDQILEPREILFGDSSTHTDAGSESLMDPAGWTAVMQMITPLFAPLARGAHIPLDRSEEEEDRLALSGCADLHTLLSMAHQPAPTYTAYPSIPVGAKGEEGKEHVVICRFRLNGKEYSTRAMRPSIKKAKNVAAWMVLEEIRAERAQNKRKAVS